MVVSALWDSLGLGMKALMFSAVVAESEDEAGSDGANADGPTGGAGESGDATTFGQTLQWTTVAVAMFFGINPALFQGSDAVFNIGTAVGAVQSLPDGVYIAMNGRIWDPAAVRKNVDANRFEPA